MLQLFVFGLLLQYVFCGIQQGQGQGDCPKGYRYLESDCVPELIKTVVCSDTVTNKMNLVCLPNNRIRVLSVVYGRSDTTTCPHQGHDTITNCTVERTEIIKQACDGKQTCTDFPPPAHFGENDPCFGTYKYLDIEYVCEYKPPTTTCETLSSTLLCPGTDVLRINSALWGRTTRKCPHSIYDTSKKCTPSSVSDTIKQRCEGKNHCLVEATSDFVGVKDPCPNTYKYLEIDYDCVPRIKNVKVCTSGSDLNLACPLHTVIKVQLAIYGRRSHFVCRSEGNDLFLACSLDKTHVIKELCDGIQFCKGGIPAAIYKVDPCVDTYKYLDIDYICVPKGSN